MQQNQNPNKVAATEAPRRVISLLVDNHNGVLARVSSLFCRRGFNIDSLTVSATNDPAVSRITVTLHGDDAANNAKLLVNLEGVADDERTARFMSVVALIDTDGLVTYGEGACEGTIAHEGRGDHGFGYDPLFLPVDTPGKTMAELTADEKNAISHRFHALEHLSAKLTGEE